MSQKRVTIQEIADACGLSRNTVSKVFNQRGTVLESTRQFVLAKARELGYFSKPAAPSPASSLGTVAVLYGSNPLNHHFGSMLMKAFTDTVCRWGFSVQMYELSAREVELRQLPEQANPDAIMGILCVELFEQGYMEMLSGLGLPVVSVDIFCRADRSSLRYDVVTMENVFSVMRLTRQLLAAGARRLGFVGDIHHCESFHERWVGFCAALKEAGLAPDLRWCVLDTDGSQYADPDWIAAQLGQMDELPDAFVCANDFLAVKLMQALKRIGLAIPGDVMVTGFDDGPESVVVEPTLTTVHIPSTELGMQAAELLLRRIRDHARPFFMVYIQTTPVFRESTCRDTP